MLNHRYITTLVALAVFVSVDAQKTYREHVRSGNKIYADSVYDKAEVEYRKAIELDAKDAQAHYNLGNALLFQNKGSNAMKEFETAMTYETDKQRQAQIYHNTGVVAHAAKDYSKAVDAYKDALRRNPGDHETRYNLALAMMQLKKQQEQEEQNKEQDKEQAQEEQAQEQQAQEKQLQEKQRQEQQQQEQQQQEQQQEQQQQQQQEQQQGRGRNEMSKENAQRLLEAAMMDEKNVQERVKKQMQLMKGRKLEKDW